MAATKRNAMLIEEARKKIQTTSSPVRAMEANKTLTGEHLKPNGADLPETHRHPIGDA